MTGNCKHFVVLMMTLSTGMAQAQERRLTQDVSLLDLQITRVYSLEDVSEAFPEVEDVVESVSTRVGVADDTIRERIRVTFMPAEPGPCPNRGLAEMNENAPSIMIFVDEDTSRDQILGVLAHELGHLFQFFGVQGGRSVVGMFNEGFASWAAGRYWLEWQGRPSFQAAVRDFLETATYLPLGVIERGTDNPVDITREACLARRDTIYNEWAAFIDFLVETYGRARLDALFQSTVGERSSSGGRSPRNLPNYPAVYGKPLARLETEWLSGI